MKTEFNLGDIVYEVSGTNIIRHKIGLILVRDKCITYGEEINYSYPLYDIYPFGRFPYHWFNGKLFRTKKEAKESVQREKDKARHEEIRKTTQGITELQNKLMRLKDGKDA